MYCQKCGAQMPDDASYCSNCGTNPLGSGQSASEQGIVNNDLVPDEIKGFNFGALMLNWIWAFSHRLWLYGFLILLIPVVNLILAVVLAFKGNELAWKARKFNSIEEFKNTQRAWMIAGIVVCALIPFIVAAMGIFAAIAIPNFTKAKDKAEFTRCVSAMSGMKVAEEMYISDNGKYTDNIDHLSMYMLPDCNEPDGSDCVGNLISRMKTNCAGDDTNLKISVSSNGFDYQITGAAGDRHKCQICMTPKGYAPSDYAMCGPDWVLDCSTIVAEDLGYGAD